MIDGVKIIPLRQIVDERGKIMHMMKATDPHFIRFGEIYFSCAYGAACSLLRPVAQGKIDLSPLHCPGGACVSCHVGSL